MSSVFTPSLRFFSALRQKGVDKADTRTYSKNYRDSPLRKRGGEFWTLIETGPAYALCDLSAFGPDMKGRVHLASRYAVQGAARFLGRFFFCTILNSSCLHPSAAVGAGACIC